MKPEIYAKAIFDLIKNRKDGSDVVEGVVKSLKDRGAITMLPKILTAYERIIADSGSSLATLTVARESDIDKARTESGAPEDVKVIIDKKIIGGHRFESNDTLVDNSYKTKLLQIYRNTVNT
jgi:F0F1-type ATP synthase delta subunit